MEERRVEEEGKELSGDAVGSWSQMDGRWWSAGALSRSAHGVAGQRWMEEKETAEGSRQDHSKKTSLCPHSDACREVRCEGDRWEPRRLSSTLGVGGGPQARTTPDSERSCTERSRV